MSESLGERTPKGIFGAVAGEPFREVRRPGCDYTLKGLCIFVSHLASMGGECYILVNSCSCHCGAERFDQKVRPKPSVDVVCMGVTFLYSSLLQEVFHPS